MIKLISHRVRLETAATILACLGVLLANGNGRAGEEPKPASFSKPIIDIGVVVRDIEKSSEFYAEAIGFQRAGGFSVSAELGKDIGLIDGHPVDVQVYALAEGEMATRLKLLSFPMAPGKLPDQSSIRSTIGLSYLTLYVADINDAIGRLKKANVKLLGKTPVSLGGNTRIVVVKDPDGNFIELIGPVKD